MRLKISIKYEKTQTRIRLQKRISSSILGVPRLCQLAHKSIHRRYYIGSDRRPQVSQTGPFAVMHYLWSENEVYKKYDMTLRLYCGQQGGRRTKSHRIKFEIQEINYQKSICMQQNAINFVENNWVEKKVPHNFLKWAFVVPLVLPQKKCLFNKNPKRFVNFDYIMAAF